MLLRKLESYGIRDRALQWVKIYLSERTQFPRMGKYSSKCLNINCGVLAGTVLAQTFLKIHFNDLRKVSSLSYCFRYDLFCSGLQMLIQDVTTEFNKMKMWFIINQLSLNMNKTKSMHFGNRVINVEITILMDGTNITQVNVIRYLGVIMDKNINWKSHIKYVQKSVAVISTARQVLDQRSLYTVHWFPISHLLGE